MKRFLAVVMALALGTVTAHAQQQEHRGRGNHGNSGNSARHSQQDVSRSENHRQNGERNRSRVDSAPLAIPQQQPLLAQNQSNDRNRGDNRGRGGDYNRRGDNNRGRDNRGTSNRGRDDIYRGRNDHRGRNDNNRSWNDNRGRTDNRRSNGRWDRNDHRWSQRGWNRSDFRRSWNHGWAGTRYRSTSRYYYPRGYSTRHWNIGVRLPSVFYTASYYLNYSTYGLAPPPWGCQWVRVDSDVMLVDLSTGEVLDVLYGFYY